MMQKEELVEETKKEMILEEIPLFESEGHMPDDIDFQWKVSYADSDIMITMEAYSNGTYVTSKSRKVKLLEE